VLGASAVLVYAWRWHLLSTGASPQRIYNGFDTRADELLIGCLGAILLSAKLVPTLTRYGGLAALFALIGIAFFGKVYWMSPTAEIVHFALMMPAVGLLTLVVILDLVTSVDGLLSRALSIRPLVYIGSISYGIYLWHWPMLIMTRNAIFGGLGILLVATLSYYSVERPILGLKHRFARSPLVRGKSSSSLGSTTPSALEANSEAR
jgi:peptidoglycan/LPS O-acetylase OafA/YrhL